MKVRLFSHNLSRSVVLLLLMLPTGCRTISPEERAESRLRHEITAQQGYRQIRAAEALSLPQPDFPIDAADPRVRIGQYRVRIAAGQKEYAAALRAAALDPDSPARYHGLESSAKLRVTFSAPEREKLRAMVDGTDSAAAGYALWALAANHDDEAQKRLTRELESPGALTSNCAYASGFLPELPEERRVALDRLSAGSDQTAAFALWALARHDAIDAAAIRARLLALPANTPEKILRFHLAALGEVGTSEDVPRLAPFLDSPEPEIGNAAAGAILKISAASLKVGEKQD